MTDRKRITAEIVIDAEAHSAVSSYVSEQLYQTIEHTASLAGRWIDLDSVVFIDPEPVTYHWPPTRSEKVRHWLRHLRAHPGHTYEFLVSRVIADTWPDALKGRAIPLDRHPVLPQARREQA